MARHDFQIPVTYTHRVCFTRHAFAAENPLVAEILSEGHGRKAWIAIEDNVAAAWPDLAHQTLAYLDAAGIACSGARILAGGEACKADDRLVSEVWRELDAHHIDRHSYVLAIGGGAFLDAVGYAAATAHRGVRLLRFPTTTLAQDDSGVGVKCAINHFGKKNWIGAFAVPFAVINDFEFLISQDKETCRAGLIEAVKVALVKDGEFFAWIEKHLHALTELHKETLETCVERSALLHARHIAQGGDPFEAGSSRPLDFGHWAAHKLESLSNHTLSHAHAVAIGLALDTLYSHKCGLLEKTAADRILHVLATLKLPLWHDALAWRDHAGNFSVLAGLEEFREHLGGTLTVLLLQDIGHGIDVHSLHTDLLEDCIHELHALARQFETVSVP